MTSLNTVLVLLLFDLLVSVSAKDLLFKRSRDSNRSRLGIYKGRPTTIQKHPYLVSVQYGGYFSCAGSIVSDNWVLTTADCVYAASPLDLGVIAGTQDGSTGGTTYKVKQVIAHPNYGSSFLDYDYALLQIEGKFKWSKTVKKVHLPKKRARVGSKTVIVGWGDESEDASLKQGKQKVLSLKACKKIYEGFDIDFTDRLICTYNKGEVAPCDGDRGDPITQKNVLYSMFIDIGAAGDCTKDAYPAIGASVLSAVPWIQNVTGLAHS